MTRKQRVAFKSTSLKGQATAAAEPGVGAANLTEPQRPPATWRLEEAKARFSEVVRRAHDHGPQYVTVRGKPAVAIIDAAELQRLLPPGPDALPLVQFLESLHIDGLDLTRERDPGRETAL